MAWLGWRLPPRTERRNPAMGRPWRGFAVDTCAKTRRHSVSMSRQHCLCGPTKRSNSTAFLLRCIRSLWAHRDASLRRTDWIAIGGIADMPGASRTSGCDATDPGCVKTLHGITAPGILSPMVRPRAKKRKNLSSARRYDQIRFRFRTTKTHSVIGRPIFAVMHNAALDPANLTTGMSQGVCSRSSTKVMVNGWPATVFPSASVNGKDAHRLSVCATAMRYDERCVSDASLD